MKNFFALVLACSWLLINACGNHTPSDPDARTADSAQHDGPDTTTNVFFPVAGYLKGEITQVDSVPQAIRKYIIQKGSTDSSFIQPAAFNELAGEFLLPELMNGDFEKKYSESSFMDNTTQTATFTYSTPDKTLPLRRVDVVTVRGRSFNKVKSIYLERSFTNGDTLIAKKMLWQVGHNFLVITSMTPPGKPAIVKQLKVVWNQDDDL
jgi:hypothetical protein